MQARSLSYCAVLLLLITLTAVADSKKAAQERPSGEGVILVRVEGLPSAEGLLFVSLYLTDEGYPGEWQQAYVAQQLPAQDAVDGRPGHDALRSRPLVL